MIPSEPLRWPPELPEGRLPLLQLDPVVLIRACSTSAVQHDWSTAVAASSGRPPASRHFEYLQAREQDIAFSSWAQQQKVDRLAG